MQNKNKVLTLQRKTKYYDMRTLIQTDEYMEYYNGLSEKIRSKFDYAMNILRSIDVPNTKFVKKLVDTSP